MENDRIGVLLMALGGPDSLDAVEPFLLNVRHGRPTPKQMVEEFRERYRRIGGKSPLLGISLEQAQALEARLNRGTDAFRCYVGMRHWSPYVRETVARIRDDHVHRVVAICLTPYYSKMSVGAYFADLDNAITRSGATFELAHVESWHDCRELIDAYANKARQALTRLAGDGFGDPSVLFTAHSLPQKIMAEGDPYERELQQTMAAISKQLPPVRARLCYQSAGRSGDSWLGPPLDDVLNDLGAAGEQAVLVVPFGFVSDHLEILYDLDIEARARARDLGMRFERAESLNADPQFIRAMEAVVRDAAAMPNWA
ncbi:MAG TPA: ferrochelatase [Thermoplasmata archaeon]|nr:ferrochelatase [Thermoplasmata archaeon]